MRDIKGYEGLYAVTSCGKVWSYRSQKFLAPRINNKGYLRVLLSKDGYTKDFYIHRLVAEAYIPNPESKPVVNHLDENPLHNNLQNLEWATQKENMNYGNCQKKKSKAVYCIELDRVFDSQTAAAKEIGITKQAINMCVHGKIETAGGYHWKYAKRV